MELNGGNGDQCHADDAKQKLYGDMLESMGRGFGDARPIRPSTSFINPAHPSVPIFLRRQESSGAIKRPDQRTVGFSLVDKADLARSVEKLKRKNLDLIVSNPLETMNSPTIDAVLLWPDGRSEELPCRSKALFADKLLERAVALF